jgi:PD-(D/E)XK endonuclease
MIKGAIVFNAQSIRSNTKGVLRRSYTGEIDLFCVYCPEIDQVYAVPVGESPLSIGRLRVAPPANGQRRGIRWAADYELPA